ncbi:MAG TPA: hypothetical protein VLE02_01395 [Nitrosarchaeum sp.]|nr:hypothetical protein [Nitrosarchaeum sp.]
MVSAIVILCAVGIYFLLRKEGFSLKNNLSREGYGPIKNISKIPKGTCTDLCGRFYQRCLNDYQSVNARVCQTKYMGCIGECSNSPMQQGVSSTRFLSSLAEFYNNPYYRSTSLYG